MKKLLLSLLVIAATTSAAWSQINILSQNFSAAGLPAGWLNIDSGNVGGIAGKWQRKTNAYGFSSTTSSNGFYIFVSYATTNDNKPENGQLRTGSINCSQYPNVALQFDHYFLTRFLNNNNSRGTVLVSTDNVNWTEVYTIDETTESDAQVRLDISYLAAYMPNVYVKFKYTGSWDGFWAVDDIKVFIPEVLDIAVKSINTPTYVDFADHLITGVVSNEGITTINNFDLTYQDGLNAAATQSFTGLNIAPFETYNFAFSKRLTMAEAAAHDLTVSASGPNYGVEQQTSNNTITKKITALSGTPKKVALIEEFTTAVCQFCPRGTTIMNEILAANPETVIGVGIHSGFGTDGMTTPDHNTLANTYTTGAPSAMIDRVLFKGEPEVGVSTDVWETYAVQQTEEAVPVAVSATTTYNASTRKLDINAAASFYGPIADTLRINAYIIEDSVTGSGSAYNQVNAYNTDNTSEWAGMGNPIVGFAHRHVARYMFGGPWGSANVIPNLTTDSTYTKDYSYTLPTTWDDEQIKVVVLVQRFSNKANNRQILNAIELELNETKATPVVPSVYIPTTGISEAPKAISDINVYPNPAADVLNIAYSVNGNSAINFSIQNMLGETVATLSPNLQTAGAYRTQLNTTDFANGVYFVAVKENGKTVSTQKFVVSK